MTKRTFWISRIHRLTSLCNAFRNVGSFTRSPKSATFGFVPSSVHFLMTADTTGWTVSVISGMSMFCCRWSRPISSSSSFFSTDGAILSPSLLKHITLPTVNSAYQVNSALHPSRVATPSTSFARVKAGMSPLCDRIRHVSSHRSLATLWTATSCYFTYFIYRHLNLQLSGQPGLAGFLPPVFPNSWK